jgi:hypothetical protein
VRSTGGAIAFIGAATIGLGAALWHDAQPSQDFKAAELAAARCTLDRASRALPGQAWVPCSVTVPGPDKRQAMEGVGLGALGAALLLIGVAMRRDAARAEGRR